MSLITLAGMDEAIANLNINPDTLKGRLALLIRSYFPTEESVQGVVVISADDLVQELWHTTDAAEIRQKKKNLSSLKSSLNKSLKKLSKQEKNPEGLVISRDNVFTVSDEHKNDLLKKMGITTGQDPVELISTIRDLLGGLMAQEEHKKTAGSLLEELDKTRDIIAAMAGLGDKNGAQDEDDSTSSGGEKEPEKLDAGGSEETDEGVELDGAEELEIVEEDLDDDTEIIEEEELDDLIEVDEDELAGGNGEQEGLDGGEDGAADEEAGLGDDEELEIIEEEDLEDDVEFIEEDMDDLIEVDEDELTGGNGEQEGLDGAADGEQEEGIGFGDDEELEIVEEENLEDDTEIIEEDMDDLIEVDEDELTGSNGEQEGLGGAGDDKQEEGIGFGDDEELEIVEEEDLEDDTEIIDEEELDDLIEVDEDELVGGNGEQEGLDGAGDSGTEDGVGLGADEELEIVEEEYLEDDTEIIDEEELGGKGESSAAPPMDLSHYIEPDEALTAQPETLAESHEDYINQILERFMPKFIKIPPGQYPIGNFPAKANERPSAHITLDSFHISQLPVTNDLFDFFVRETGYETDAEKNNFGTVTQPRMYSRIDPDTGRNILTIRQGTGARRITGANWKHPAGPGSSLENKGNHPVVQVSRRDALAFASWAGKRLPSEDEWEATARGPKGVIFPWGNEWDATLGNFEKSQIGDTCPVTRHGQESISPFGLYDMLGNVFEWTASIHQPAQQATSPIYILKGGCWASKSIITAATRLLERDTWSNIIGFRCAV